MAIDRTDAPPGGGTVRILPADVRLGVRPGESIVDAVRRNGYRMRYSCRRGGCGACKADLLEGSVVYAVPIAGSVLSDQDLEDGKCLPCRALPCGEVVIGLSSPDDLRRVFGSAHPTGSTAG